MMSSGEDNEVDDGDEDDNSDGDDKDEDEGGDVAQFGDSIGNARKFIGDDCLTNCAPVNCQVKASYISVSSLLKKLPILNFMCI